MTLRAEAAVFSAVALVVVGSGLLAVRRPARVAAVGLLFTLAFLAPVGLNQLLEQRAVGQVVRPQGGLARGTAVRDIGTSLDVRVENAFITTLAVQDPPKREIVIVSMMLVAFLALAIKRARETDHLAQVAMIGVAAVYAAVAVSGWGFVPSLFVAAPVALVGVLGGWNERNLRLLSAIALLSLPLVWLSSPADGAAPQWGGRYLLMSGVLLTPVGVTALWSFPAWMRRSLIGLAVAVTMFGVGWLFVRTNRVASLMGKLEDRQEQVLVSTEGFFWREGGSFYNPRRRWLVAMNPTSDMTRVSGIIRGAGLGTFALVESGWTAEGVPVPGFCATGHGGRLDFIKSSVRVTSYRAGDDC